MGHRPKDGGCRFAPIGARVGLMIVAVLLVLAAEPLASVRAAVTFTVTTTADAGPGSLRQAIIDANATTDTDTITFAIPPAGAHVISLATALPAISQPVVINGQDQPGFAGSPLIRLDNATG